MAPFRGCLDWADLKGASAGGPWGCFWPASAPCGSPVPGALVLRADAASDTGGNSVPNHQVPCSLAHGQAGLPPPPPAGAALPCFWASPVCPQLTGRPGHLASCMLMLGLTVQSVCVGLGLSFSLGCIPSWCFWCVLSPSLMDWEVCTSGTALKMGQVLSPQQPRTWTQISVCVHTRPAMSHAAHLL